MSRLQELESIPKDTFLVDRRAMRKQLGRMAAAGWFVYGLVIIVPRTAEGFTWITVIIFGPVWLMVGAIVWRFKKVFAEIDAAEEVVYATRRKHRALIDLQYERAERAQKRLDRIKKQQEREQALALAKDVDALRRELGGEDGDTPSTHE